MTESLTPRDGERRWWRPGFRSGLSTICVAGCYVSLPLAFCLFFLSGRTSNVNLADFGGLLFFFVYDLVPVILLPLGILSSIVAFARTGRRQFVFEVAALALFAAYWRPI